MNKTILYIGGFELPDKNAAAQRVMANAKMLREIGYNVVFISVNKKINCNQHEPQIINGFNCYFAPYPKNMYEWFKYITDISYVKKISREISADFIICYNYPSLCLKKIIKYSQENSIKIVGDITEWYLPEGHFPKRIIKKIDIDNRMKKLNKKMDGLIVVSTYLENYYKPYCKHIVRIPTLVDIDFPLTKVERDKDKKEIIFIGNVGVNFSKERLDIVVEVFMDYHEVDKSITLTIIGETKENLKEYYPNIEYYDNITILGKITHDECLNRLYSADFSIIPRERKINTIAGFPTKLTESFMCGTPVIATNVGDIGIYIIDVENGYLLNECTKQAFIEVFKKISELTYQKRLEMKSNAKSMNKLVVDNFTDDITSFLINIK